MHHSLQPGLAAARGGALFLGGFALLNLVVGWVRPGFAANGWWIDLRLFPDILADAVVGLTAAFMLAWALRPQAHSWRRIVTVALLGLMMLLAREVAAWWKYYLHAGVS